MQTLLNRPRTSETLDEAINRFSTVNLKELDTAQLHDRIESKVLLAADEVPNALKHLNDDYFILEHLGDRVQQYKNSYFDSRGLQNYHDHHNQKRRRLKVRYRTYVNSEITFFEIKRNVSGRTVKDRKLSQAPTDRLWSSDAAFFEAQTGRSAAPLVPSLSVSYERVLLVKKDFSERVTIDLSMTFTSAEGSTIAPALAVVEFKQPRMDNQSPAVVAVRHRPQKFSKYCMGLASCDNALKRNRFKKVFLGLESLLSIPNPIQEISV